MGKNTLNEVDEYSKTQNINGFVGWFKSTVTEYERPIETSKAIAFNDYPQRSYDYDQLEKELLGWDKEDLQVQSEVEQKEVPGELKVETKSEKSKKKSFGQKLREVLEPKKSNQ